MVTYFWLHSMNVMLIMNLIHPILIDYIAVKVRGLEIVQRAYQQQLMKMMVMKMTMKKMMKTTKVSV